MSDSAVTSPASTPTAAPPSPPAGTTASTTMPAAGAPATTAAPAPSTSTTTDPRDVAFAQRERLLVQRQREMAAAQAKAQADHDAKLKEINERSSRLAETEKLLARAKVDPDAVAKSLWGESYYDDFTARRVGGKLDPTVIESRIDEKLTAFEQRQKEQRERERQEEAKRAQAEEQQLVENLSRQADAFVKADPEKYELTNAYGQSKMIVDVMNEVARQTGRVPSIAEAAEQVERYLEEQGDIFAKSKRFAARQKVPSSPPPPAASVPPTISSRMTPSTPSAEPIATLDPEERNRQIIARYASRT